MSPHVAVAHYPEGAGHATRMLAIARGLERGGATVAIAGGGPGARFVDLNGYDYYAPARVDYIDDFQDGGNLLRVIAHSVPRSGKRVVDYVRWLRREDPAALVTDDMFAAMAAPIARVPLYVLTHNAPRFYDDRVEESFTWLLTDLQLRICREFFYPAVWPPAPEDPDGVTRVPPVALGAEPADARGTRAPERAPDGGADPEVLVVPSHYSRGFDDLAERIASAGREVALVGGDDWSPIPALLPVIERADAVVCSGYSTVMEAAVAGTACVLYPFTDEQRGVARTIEAAGTDGIATATSPEDVLSALSDPPAAPARENGADVVAERILADL